MKNIPLHWRIIIGMVLGVAFGFAMTGFDWGPKLVSDWIKPFGTMFINALKLIAVPLILASLVKGISDLKDISQFSKMGVRTIALYMATTVFAVSFGLLVVNVIKPGNLITEETRTDLVSEYSMEASEKQQQAFAQQESSEAAGPLQALEDLIPENIFGAASDNTNMLQVIFFAILFGICMILIPEKAARPVKKFFDSFNDIILKMIDLIMRTAPYGVFALLAAIVVESPNTDLFVALGLYAVTVLVGLILLIVFYNILVYLFGGRTPLFFMKAMAPVQLLGFSTSSSAATLPLTMETVERDLGVEKDVSSFVLPIGATINMDGTSLYQAVAAVFIAQAFGMDLTFVQQLTIVATATLASIGAAAVPGTGMVMLVIVLQQVGIPLEGLALIFAIDRPLDMCRTINNVTGDATVSLIVGKSIGRTKTQEELIEAKQLEEKKLRIE